jgi:chromate transporter
MTVSWRRAAAGASHDRRAPKWLTDPEFVELLGCASSCPGQHHQPVGGAGHEVPGLEGGRGRHHRFDAVPSMVVILLGMIYQHFQHDPNVKHLFAGLAAAAAGLLIQMAVKIALPLRRNLVLAAVAVICFMPSPSCAFLAVGDAGDDAHQRGPHRALR